MTTACIVQARVASTRLPGKVLKDLAGEPVLGHVLRRCQAVPGIDITVCATVDSAECEPIETLARSYGAVVHRGPESDVLERYRGAAQLVGADVIMRVTSDCPIIDPDVCGEVLALRERENADYAANNIVHAYPHGLDCECFTRDALERASDAADEPYDREHVTPWIRRHEAWTKASLAGPDPALAKWRWTLDYPEDLDFFRVLYRYLPPPPAIASWREIADIVEHHPEIGAINQCRAQR